MRVKPLDESAILWSREPDGGPLLVMLHGYGGNEYDFEPFLDRVPQGVTAASLRGPTPLRDRWCWVDFPSEGVAGATAAVRGVLAWLDRTPASRAALLGFSQGGATAVHLLRSAPTRVEAVAEVSGFVWEGRAHSGVARIRPPVFSAFGEVDEVVDARLRGLSEAWLGDHCATRFARYPGIGHVMHDRILGDALAFLTPFLLPDGS